jgi:hypothetical protein
LLKQIYYISTFKAVSKHGLVVGISFFPPIFLSSRVLSICRHLKKNFTLLGLTEADVFQVQFNTDLFTPKIEEYEYAEEMA